MSLIEHKIAEDFEMSHAFHIFIPLANTYI